MKRRILSILLLAALVIGLLPQSILPVSAYNESDIAYPVEGGNLYFDKATATITDCDESVTKADIPAKINGIAVAGIGDSAFSDCSSLTGVRLPSRLARIGSFAFQNCSSLTSITIPKDVTSISGSAFESCSSLWHVHFLGDMPTFGADVFDHCSDALTLCILEDAQGWENCAYATELWDYHLWLTDCSKYVYVCNTCGDSYSNLNEDDHVSGDYFAIYSPFYNMVMTTEVSTYTAADGTTRDRMLSAEATLENGELTTDAENVALFRIETVDGVTSFVTADGKYLYADEWNLRLADTESEYTRFVLEDTTDGQLIRCETVHHEGKLRYVGYYAAGSVFGVGSGIYNGFNTVAFYAPANGGFHEHIVHTWDKGTVTKEATCTEEGEMTFTCTQCGRSKAEKIAAKGHTEVVDAAVPATCTESGLTEGKHCSVCGVVLVAQEAVPAPGHSYKDGVCTVCGAKDPDYRPVAPVEFSDVSEKAWYYDAVQYASQNGLMNGVGNGKFDPEGSMTRAMLVTVLWRYEGEPAGGENIFTDVPNGTWYTDAAAWAASNGIVGGIGNGKFDPDGSITREQMATILFRYAQKKGIDTSKRGELSGFADSGNVSSWAKDAVQWTVAEKNINGSDGKLLPQGNATRAQVSASLMRFLENIEKK